MTFITIPTKRMHILRRGVTLAELLVVLMILAVLATAAVKSLGPVADHARIEATQRTLDNIREAITGSHVSDAQYQSIGGYVADMGDVPQDLAELIISPDESLSYTTAFPNVDVDPICSGIRLPFGWKGPYLFMPGNGDLRPVDGWGATIQIASGTGGIAFLSNPPPGTSVQGQPITSTIPYNAIRAAAIWGRVYKADTDPNNHSTPPTRTWRIHLVRVVRTGTGSYGYDSVLLGTCNAEDNPPFSYSSDDASESEIVLLDKPLFLNIGVVAIRAVSGAVVTDPIYLTLRPGATYHVDIKEP